MGRYRVTMKIEFLVDSTEDNLLADPRAPLQGDTAEAAANRASWCWLKGMGLARETCRALGVGRSWARKAEVHVVAAGQGPPVAEPDGGPA